MQVEGSGDALLFMPQSGETRSGRDVVLGDAEVTGNNQGQLMLDNPAGGGLGSALGPAWQLRAPGLAFQD